MKLHKSRTNPWDLWVELHARLANCVWDVLGFGFFAGMIALTFFL